MERFETELKVSNFERTITAGERTVGKGPYRGRKMHNISDSKRDAAECRRAAAAETNPDVARQLLLIADAWDKVIREYERVRPRSF